MPILSNLLGALNPQPLAPTLRQQQLSSPLGKSSFTGIRIDAKSINFTQISTSTNHHSSLFPYPSDPNTISTSDSYPENKSTETTYPVPKTLEECFSKGILHLLLWELRGDPFTGDLEAWRGWYTVWYIPKIRKIYLLKLKNEEGEGAGGYVDVPSVEERDKRFWFWPEMQEIKKALVDRFGE